MLKNQNQGVASWVMAAVICASLSPLAQADYVENFDGTTNGPGGNDFITGISGEFAFSAGGAGSTVVLTPTIDATGGTAGSPALSLDALATLGGGGFWFAGAGFGTGALPASRDNVQVSIDIKGTSIGTPGPYRVILSSSANNELSIEFTADGNFNNHTFLVSDMTEIGTFDDAAANINIVVSFSGPNNEAQTGWGTGGTLFIDNINIADVTPIPEPASVVLLGLGLATLFGGKSVTRKPRDA